MKSKETICEEEYGCSLDELTVGEKASVTRKYNAQSRGRRTTAAAGARAVKVSIGRVGVNGTYTVLVQPGTKVKDAIDQAKYTIDSSKEGVVAHSTGEAVSLRDAVVNNETYIITPEIKSA